MRGKSLYSGIDCIVCVSRRTNRMRIVQILCLILCISTGCSGVTFLYSASDNDTDGTYVMGTNSLASHNLFTSGTFGLTNIDFNSVALGTLNGSLGSGVSVTCTSCDSSAFFGQTLSGVVSMASTSPTLTTDGYNTTGTTTSASAAGQYYRVGAASFAPSTSTVTFTFASPASGVGMYITGLESWIGGTTLTYIEDGSTLHTFTPNPLPNTNSASTDSNPAGIQFVGIRDTGHVINSITLVTTNTLSAHRDIFGIDDIVFGDAEPEPSVIVLTASGLAALLLLRRKRSAKI